MFNISNVTFPFKFSFYPWYIHSILYINSILCMLYDSVPITCQSSHSISTFYLLLCVFQVIDFSLSRSRVPCFCLPPDIQLFIVFVTRDLKILLLKSEEQKEWKTHQFSIFQLFSYLISIPHFFLHFWYWFTALYMLYACYGRYGCYQLEAMYIKFPPPHTFYVIIYVI